MLQLRQLTFAYPQRPIFDRFSADLAAARICLQAPNGFGKSTLLLLTAGLLKPQNGDICCDNKPLPTQQRLQQIAIASDSIALPDWLTADQLIDLQCHSWHQPRPVDLLNRFQLNSFLATPFGQLSTGNQKKCRLIMALLRQSRYLLLDEPSAGLDQHSLQQLAAILAEYPGQVIITSHETDWCQAAGFIMHPLG